MWSQSYRPRPCAAGYHGTGDVRTVGTRGRSRLGYLAKRGYVPAVGVLADTAVELNGAFDELLSSGGTQPQHRRALRALLASLYEVRAYRVGSALEWAGGREIDGTTLLVEYVIKKVTASKGPVGCRACLIPQPS